MIAKAKGFDIRTKGSGNAGASNALILFGKLTGFFCALFDIAKAYFIIMLSEVLFEKFELAFVITGTFCVIGHIFPFYMKFKGGKGLASLSGMVLYYDFKVFLILLVTAIIIVLVSDYICFVPIIASIVFPFIYLFSEHNMLGFLVLFGITFSVIFRHAENLKRIRLGTEMHLSYLWNPEKEMKRMKRNILSDEKKTDEHFLIK